MFITLWHTYRGDRLTGSDVKEFKSLPALKNKLASQQEANMMAEFNGEREICMQILPQPHPKKKRVGWPENGDR